MIENKYLNQYIDRLDVNQKAIDREIVTNEKMEQAINREY